MAEVKAAYQGSRTQLHYFLDIEVLRTRQGIHLNQRRCVLDMLKEASTLDAKPVESPMELGVKLNPYEGEPLENVSRLDLSFAVVLFSQLM